MGKKLEKKEFRQYGAYGIIIKDDKILLIKKNGGPYDGKLDLPGGTIEFHEKPENTLKRELLEEVGIVVKKFKLLDADSVDFEWEFNNLLIDGHHVGIFYEVLEFENNIQSSLNIDEVNDDSLGAEFYSIKKLNKTDLSLIALLELEKLGYKLK
mgnify:CR=1 FL=1